ncbi:MAG: ABC transporter ATP-binding protein, partial [Epulopiscium sp.]|nr:ABC transporter ATP-binding protein [Candidatus Epulonipiscium sp.]
MKIILQLLQAARKYWKYLILSMVAMLVLTVAQLFTPWIVRELISLVTSQDPELGQKALNLAIILAIAYGVQAIAQYIRSYYTHFAAWHFVSDIRVKLYDHLQSLSLEYYHDKQTGQLMSRTSNDTATLELLIAHAAPDLIVNLLILIGVASILFYINVTLAFLSLVTVPLLVIMAGYFAKKVLPTFKQAHQTLAEFNATLHDNLSGIKEIQVFNQQEREKNRILESSHSYTIAIIKALRLSAIYHPTMQFLSNMGTVLVIGYGGYLASIGKVPVEDIVAFILYLNMFYQPISNLARINEDFQNALAGADRIFEVLNTPSAVTEVENPIELKSIQGELLFDDVSFSYEPGVDVLKNIHLQVNSGEMVALVGPTGVGKTTLISLLHRFYDPTEGSILVDQQDIRN